MILFKGCPKCRGDMKVTSDMYGEYRQCILCGLIQDVDSPAQRTSAPAVVTGGVKAPARSRAA